MNKKILKEIHEIKTKMGLISEEVNEKFLGLRVMVYYNLHKHTFSVKHNNRIILYADYIKLGDVVKH